MNDSDPRKFEALLDAPPPDFDAPFSDGERRLLGRYYEIVLKWNPRLHLTTIAEPAAFLTRHVLESWFAARFLREEVREVWDFGSGIGVPGLLLAVRRPDLQVHLVEAGKKKALFLEEVAAALPLPNLCVHPVRFETLAPLPAHSCLTARAVEEMERWIPEFVRLSAAASQILLLGADRLEPLLRRELPAAWDVRRLLLPGSAQRFLIEAHRST